MLATELTFFSLVSNSENSITILALQIVIYFKKGDRNFAFPVVYFSYWLKTKKEKSKKQKILLWYGTFKYLFKRVNDYIFF